MDRTKDIYLQQYYSNTSSKPMLRTYKNFKTVLELEDYIDAAQIKRLYKIIDAIHIIQFRHALALHMIGPSYFPIGIKSEDRLCRSCLLTCIKDHHFVLIYIMITLIYDIS